MQYLARRDAGFFYRQNIKMRLREIPETQI